MTLLPLLRAPPFSGEQSVIAKACEGTKGRRRPTAATIDSDRLRKLIAMIRNGRVGGCFWLPPGSVANATLQPDAAVDPWSVLSPKVVLTADAGSEWCVIAAIVGARIVDSNGQAISVSEARFAAALLDDIDYIDPFSGQASTAEATVALLTDWRKTIDSNRTIAVATGMAWWKRRSIQRFLDVPGRPALLFRRTARSAVKVAQLHAGAIASWPSRAPAGLRRRADAAGVQLVTIEDGFIRSIGLGSDLNQPRSIVVDGKGAHYDPRSASDLENILQTTDFSPALLARAMALRRSIVAAGITKYSADRATHDLPPRDERRLVLVTGQVEDDLSVQFGGAGIVSNADFLRRARQAEPDAQILFKPHPDVDAGHRAGRLADREILVHADAVVRGVPMQPLLDHVDGVHVLTSLAGFEALMRGCDVSVHGQPFYAGWGLTRDFAPPLNRRTRSLSLDMLVAGVLILYPRYLDPQTALPCPPEVLVRRFSVQDSPASPWIVRLRRLQGRLFRDLGIR